MSDFLKQYFPTTDSWEALTTTGFPWSALWGRRSAPETIRPCPRCHRHHQGAPSLGGSDLCSTCARSADGYSFHPSLLTGKRVEEEPVPLVPTPVPAPEPVVLRLASGSRR